MKIINISFFMKLEFVDSQKIGTKMVLILMNASKSVKNKRWN